jgi:hypothetical protein
MTHKHIPLIPLFLTLALVTACGGGDETLHASGADLFAEFGEVACEKGVQCGTVAPGDVELCVDVIVQDICELDPETCITDYSLSRSEWDACLDAFFEQTCPAAASGVLPTECTTIEELWE